VIVTVIVIMIVTGRGLATGIRIVYDSTANSE
jgi:hypothetical protein